jgi:hypothetical protein
MATILQIKRTNTANLPSTLDQGELAYIYDTAITGTSAGGNGGRLYIGDPTTNTNTPIKIGGKYYTDLMDHTLGTITASAAVLLDSNKKVNEFFVDNIKLDGNTISSTDANGDLTISPNGTGKTVIKNVYVGDGNTSLEEFIEDITGGAVTADNLTLVSTYDDTAGTITLSIKDGGVGTTQIADAAVTTAKIADSGVTTAKIADGNVTTAKIADSGVTTVKIADANVTTDKIANSAVTTVKIADLNVTTAKIADGNVTTAKIADSGVTTVKIADANVTTDKIADANVTTAKIADSAVTTVKIADVNVTTAKIADSAVTTVKIADANVTSAKLGDGSVTTNKISDGAVTNVKLANSSITLGSDTVSLGGTLTDINGVTSIDIDNINIDGNIISSTNTDGNIAIAPDGEGTITVPAGYESRNSFGDDSLVNKKYVDTVAQGLQVKESVKATTTTNLDATYNNTDGTLTGDANGALVLDGVTLASGDRVLIKNQTDPVENGIYTVTLTGSAGAAFALKRAPDADTASELTGGTFFFVEQGTSFGDAGFVATHDGIPTFGTTDITFEQFSGAGQISDGAGLSKTGNTLNVNVDDSTIEINGSDNLQLKDGGITNAKVSSSAAITQSKLSLNAATTRANATGIAQSNLGVVSFDNAQFTLTNGWAQVTRLDAGAYV